MMEDLKISAVFSLVSSSDDAVTCPKSGITDDISSFAEDAAPDDISDDDAPPTLTSVAVRNPDSTQINSLRSDNDTPPILQPEEMSWQASGKIVTMKLCAVYLF